MPSTNVLIVINGLVFQKVLNVSMFILCFNHSLKTTSDKELRTEIAHLLKLYCIDLRFYLTTQKGVIESI